MAGLLNVSFLCAGGGEISIQTKIYQEGKWQLNEKFNKHRIDYKQQNGVKGET